MSITNTEIGSGHPGAAEVEPPAAVLHAGGSSEPEATAIGARAAELLAWCDHVERFAYERAGVGLDASPHLLAGAARRLVAQVVVGGSR